MQQQGGASGGHPGQPGPGQTYQQQPPRSPMPGYGQNQPQHVHQQYQQQPGPPGQPGPAQFGGQRPPMSPAQMGPPQGQHMYTQQHPQQFQQRHPPHGPSMRPMDSPNGVAGQLAQMSIGVAPTPPIDGRMGYASPPPNFQQPQEMAPVKGKRAARAYHQEDSSNAPGPSPMPYQQQQGDYMSAQQQQYQQQQPHQHPYANAPPASGPQSQYQQQQPQRPDYLQASQPQGPPAYQQPPYEHLHQQPGIPQPPHNPGTKLPGLRNRIDPEQIPSVVAVQDQDQDIYDNEAYLTCGRGTVPLSTTQFTAIDQGSSIPRFMRFTTYNLPATSDLADMSHVPMGAVIQPFATPQTDKGEEPVYTVDFSQTAPPRCKRCRGYINPWCMFIEAGQKFVCNLCGQATEVPPEYFSHLDMNGRRLDLEQRPELLKGSIDMIVPKDYWVQDAPPAGSSSSLTQPRPPLPLHYVFAIDVSADTSRMRGAQPGQAPDLHPHPMLREVCESLKQIIYGDEDTASPEPAAEDGAEQPPRRGGLPAGAKVAIMTFDKVVQFYNLKPELDKAQMLVVGDIDDMFVPLSEGFLVDAWQSKNLIVSLLDSLPDLFSHNTIIEAAIGGPLKAGLLALKLLGGQLNIFQTRLPTVGPGLLKHRDETKLQGTDKERTLFVPQDPFYRQMAEEAVESGIGINLFLFPSQFIDVASLGVLAGLSGGDVYFHPRFDPVRDGSKLHSQLSRVLTRETAYCVTMRIRCSEGLRIADHYGNFHQRNVTDLEFGTMDADKAVAALIKHESKLDDKRDAYLQCAVLYTNATGERRVRLHNIAIPVTQVIANVFRFADMDATMTYCAKEAIAKTISKPLREVRDNLTDLCTKVLLAYRKHCASTTSPGQLILPESFKLFPIYALAFMKTKALKGGPVVSDVRTHYMRYIKSMGVQDTMELLYPKMLPVHTLSPEAVQPDEHGRIRLPRMMRVSYARMEPHGSYLVYNGDIAVLWFGSAVSPQILRDLYDVDTLEELNPRMTRLPALPTRLSEQIRQVLSIYEERRQGRKLPVYIARQNLDGIEIEFSNMLIEDANNDNLSYVDYLCFVHKNIQQALSGEKQSSEVDAQSMWRTW